MSSFVNHKPEGFIVGSQERIILAVLGFWVGETVREEEHREADFSRSGVFIDVPGFRKVSKCMGDEGGLGFFRHRALTCGCGTILDIFGRFDEISVEGHNLAFGQ